MVIFHGTHGMTRNMNLLVLDFNGTTRIFDLTVDGKRDVKQNMVERNIVGLNIVEH